MEHSIDWMRWFIDQIEDRIDALKRLIERVRHQSHVMWHLLDQMTTFLDAMENQIDTLGQLIDAV